ncbi:MAG: type III-B CRISPR module RAMP protein Cmr1 [Desulfobacterales bacterium]|nr:MAG: type III-B CRISPR module RAMP protein Cmr1 [Desulfobacterales bacterium]
MPRKNPPQKAPNCFTSKNDTGLTYRIEAVTPIVGGGINSYVPDKTNPVRPSAIKGQLRFWWRSMQDVSSPEKLLEKEKRIWGGIAGTDQDKAVASSVIMKIEDVTAEYHTVLERNDKGYIEYDEYPAYVLFPFQGHKEKDSFTLTFPCIFTLKLQCPQKYKDEVDKSVRLWLLFGGIGARTSRGCGSLYCEQVMETFKGSSAIEKFLRECASDIAPKAGRAPFPVLAHARFASSSDNTGNVEKGWKNLLNKYGAFRQQNARGGKMNRGRTRWADADAIRLMTKEYDYNIHPTYYQKPYFPRAAYGLPIQYEFKEKAFDPQGKFEVRPSNMERWPSPVIIKTIQLNNEKYLNICLVLNSKIPPLELCKKEKSLAISEDAHPDNWKKRRLQKGLDEERDIGENPFDFLFVSLDVKEVKNV